MQYKYFSPQSEEILEDNFESLKKILENDLAYWLSGSGASSLEVKNNEMLIFFKKNEGFAIIQNPNYTMPLIIETKSQLQ